MLPIDPATDRALVGRQARWPPGLWSALAGFLEHGESLEEGAAREVFEESGIVVDICRYHSSQPWPFPYSLMTGFLCRAISTELHVDKEELEDAKWITRQEAREHLVSSSGTSGQRCAPKGTIAHELVTAFAEGSALSQFDKTAE